MRLVAAAVLVSLAVPSAALAENASVVAGADNEFTPSDVRIAPGESVNFSYGGGFAHNVKFEDGQFEQPSEPGVGWSVTRPFPAAGRFAFYCEAHGGPGGVGMSGIVTVAAPGTQPPPDTTSPAVSALKAKRKGKRGIAVSFSSSEAGKATISLFRGKRKLVTVSKAAQAGTNKRTFRRVKGKRLRKGRYKVTVRVADSAGNRSPAKSARIRLRK